MDQRRAETQGGRLGRLRRRLFATTGAISVSAALCCAPSAFAVGDPVATGSLTLSLSGGFSHQLKHNGVKMVRKEFTIKKGSIDPTDGSGSLTLGGKLKFKNGSRTAALKKVSVTLGHRGALKAKGTKLFGLGGGNVDRQGFGAQIQGVNARLLHSGAKLINRKLGLHSLHKGGAGTVSVSEQPQTVRVTDGQTRVVPSIDPNNSVGLKLFNHCVNPILGVTAIPPAQQDSNLNFVFSAVGGTIGPDGKDGLTLHSGGSQVSRDPTNIAGPCASVPSATNIQQTDLQIDLNTNHVFAKAVINGYPPPLGGNKDVAIAMNIDRRHETVDAHPKAKKITIGNLDLTLSAGSVAFLNIAFPNQLGNPSRDFKTSDVFGTATMTLNTR